MQPAVLLFLGGLTTVAGYSAQNTYEELDQNVPFITWATLAMQAVGFLLIGVALYKASPSKDMFLWLGLAALLTMFAATVASMYVSVSNMIVALTDLIGALLLAACIGRGAMLPSIVAGISAVTLVASKHMVLPYEEERRVAHGPGMALLTLAWMGLAWALLMSVQLPLQPGLIDLNGGSQPNVGPIQNTANVFQGQTPAQPNIFQGTPKAQQPNVGPVQNTANVFQSRNTPRAQQPNVFQSASTPVQRPVNRSVRQFNERQLDQVPMTPNPFRQGPVISPVSFSLGSVASRPIQ